MFFSATHSSFFSNPGTYITLNAAQTPTVLSQSWVGYARNSYCSLEPRVSSRDKKWPTAHFFLPAHPQIFLSLKSSQTRPVLTQVTSPEETDLT